MIPSFEKTYSHLKPMESFNRTIATNRWIQMETTDSVC